MNRIFISYKRADKGVVFPLHDRIEAATGERCWIDLEEIESDAQFERVIIKAINQAEVFLFMYSHQHTKIEDYENDWTVKEINFAQFKKKRIVFINLDRSILTDWFVWKFGFKQQVDATSESAIERLTQDICRWLKINPPMPKLDKKPVATNEDKPNRWYKDDELAKGKPSVVEESIPVLVAKNVLIGSLYYNLYDNGVAEVTCQERRSSANYSGLKISVIPPSVCFNSVTYNVASIGKEAFSCCTRLKSITIPNSVTSIGEEAFSGSKGLTSVTIPNSVTSIGENAFHGCSGLTNVTISNNVTSIGSAAFALCGRLTSVTIPNSVASIGKMAFMECSSLTSVVISNSVTSIGDAAFSYCTRLKSITIPNSVTTIGDFAFHGCSGLTSITCKADVPPIVGTNFALYNVNESIMIYVPYKSVKAYKTADGWKEFNIVGQ